MATGATGQVELNRNLISDTKIVVPDKELQEQFSDIISQIWQKRSALTVKFTAVKMHDKVHYHWKTEIKPHRERINRLDKHGHDIEYNFKDPEHPLQLVFVCAMWLTGFDAPTLSTL